MRRIGVLSSCMAGLLAVSVARTPEARAAVDNDLVAIRNERCKVDSKLEYELALDRARRQRDAKKIEEASARLSAFNELCTSQRVDWARVRDKKYPRQYFIVKYAVDVCADLKLVKLKDDTDTRERIAAACEIPTTTETAATSFAEVGINVVLGLGDLL